MVFCTIALCSAQQGELAKNSGNAPGSRKKEPAEMKTLLAHKVDSMVHGKRYILRADHNVEKPGWLNSDMNYIVVDSGIINVLFTDVNIPYYLQFGRMSKGIPTDGEILNYNLKEPQKPGGSYFLILKYDIQGRGYAMEITIYPNGSFAANSRYFQVTGKVEPLD